MANKKPNTQEQFAKLANASQSEVAKLLRTGVLTRGATIGQWLGEYIEHLRAGKAGWSSQDGLVDRIREAALLDRKKRELLELQIAEKVGTVVPSASIVELFRFQHIAIRAKLVGLAHGYRSKVPRLTPKEVDLLHEMALGVLAELSHERFPRAIAERIQRDMADIHTAVQANHQPVGRPIPRAKRGK